MNLRVGMRAVDQPQAEVNITATAQQAHALFNGLNFEQFERIIDKIAVMYRAMRLNLNSEVVNRSMSV